MITVTTVADLADAVMMATTVAEQVEEVMMRAEGAAQAAALAQGMAQGIVRKTVAIRGTKTPANAIAVQILSSAEAAETGLISANAALFTVNR
jgi:hypothetical protein